METNIASSSLPLQRRVFAGTLTNQVDLHAEGAWDFWEENGPADSHTSSTSHTNDRSSLPTRYQSYIHGQFERQIFAGTMHGQVDISLEPNFSFWDNGLFESPKETWSDVSNTFTSSSRL